MIVMQVIGLTVDSNTKTPLVVLQDESGQDILPIWIGAMEAMAISLALSGSVLPRPLTHDLLLNTVGQLGGELDGVEIHAMREGTYHADLILRQGTRVLRVDCRPSDAIALALRVGAAIRVNRQVLHSATEARQRPGDPLAARLLQPQDAATDMMRQAAARMAASMAGTRDMATEALSTANKTSPPLHASDEDPEEQKLAELLQTMEPDSPRRM